MEDKSPVGVVSTDGDDVSVGAAADDPPGGMYIAPIFDSSISDTLPLLLIRAFRVFAAMSSAVPPPPYAWRLTVFDGISISSAPFTSSSLTPTVNASGSASTAMVSPKLTSSSFSSTSLSLLPRRIIHPSPSSPNEKA